MGILDEAIREHLELKRQHGAGDSELKELEDDAFGPPARPGEEGSMADPFAEAPTEFMSVPTDGEAEEESGSDEPEAAEEKAAVRREPTADIQEPLPPEPVEEEHPAMEHETVPEPPSEPPPDHSTEERHAIAEQPTEFYDVAGELASSEPVPSEEELIEEEMNEPRLAPVDPAGEIEAIEEGVEDEEEEDDDFFDEQRLSDELDQALEAPSEVDEEEPSAEVEIVEVEDEDEDEYEEEDDDEEESSSSEEKDRARKREEDLLEDTPDFLEDAPEDDQLWFEQKPPKDFDFDD